MVHLQEEILEKVLLRLTFKIFKSIFLNLRNVWPRFEWFFIPFLQIVIFIIFLLKNTRINIFTIFFLNFFSNVNFSSEFKSFLFTIIFFPLVPFTLQFVYKQRLALKSIQFVENELKFDLEYPIYDQIIELRKSWPYEEMCNFCFRKIIVFENSFDIRDVLDC